MSGDPSLMAAADANAMIGAAPMSGIGSDTDLKQER
jgi:hypothetical protein